MSDIQSTFSTNRGNRSVTPEISTPRLPVSTTLPIVKRISPFSESTTLASVEQTTTKTVSYPTDCSGYNITVGLSAVHTISIHDFDSKTALVSCLSTDDGVWTVIQRRFEGSVDFYRGWTDYKEGFGDASGEYWLGNDAMHKLTSRSSYKLKVVLRALDDVTGYAIYDTFRISNESDGYRLTIGGYHGDAGDSLGRHNGEMFSTPDQDNDSYTTVHCAIRYKGAWWYFNCHESNLNGLYLNEAIYNTSGIVWNSFATGFSLKDTTMMIQTI